MYPDILSKTIEYFKKFNGIGEKTAERLSMSVLDMTKEDVVNFAKSINELKEAEKYNPSVIILDIPEEKLREISMVVKLPVPTLLYSDKMYEDLKLRGDVYDYVTKPVNEQELKIRLRNFSRLKELREKQASEQT